MASLGSNYRTGCVADILGTGATAYNRACDAADYYNQFTEEDFYRAILNKNGLGASVVAKYEEATAIVKRGSKFQRDRLLGFRQGGVPVLPSGSNVVWNNDTGLVGNSYGGAQVFTGCDPDVFNGATPADERKIALAMSLCQGVSRDVKFPSLYYLFPYFAHDHNGKNDSATTGISLDHTQPPTEEYIADAYITTANTNGTAENNYYAVSDADILAIGTAFAPRATDFSNWSLPTTSASGVLTNPNTQPFTITMGSSGRDVSLLDKGMYDGREMLGLRMLDLDIGKLAGNTNGTGGDRWISNTDGIVYAFREDAIREDAIVRPKNSTTTWADCDTWSEVYTNITTTPFGVSGNDRNCRMKKISTAPFFQDPPLMSNTKISTKPIDFYADPDRRPYGFRLVNGATLNRASGVPSGMTFVSDNMVYTKGDFNLHTSTGALGTGSTACNGLIEEFTSKLIANDCSIASVDFYGGRTVAQRNDTNFAAPSADKWRPVEIVGDAVGVLSGTFKDGNIADGFTLARAASGNASTGSSSYQNQNRLLDDTAVAASAWKHTNPSDVNTPILINRNGDWVKSDGSLVPNSDYLQFSTADPNFVDKRGGDLQQATRTIANAVFISGIVPSQAGQTYGGMHNFPRFIESWKSTNLQIAGGFFQLNFSTSATASFDQDAWEPYDPAITAASTDSAPNGDARVGYVRTRFYGAPNRIWGYDVGLQYAPAGAIARRFVTVGRPRSEFYRELPVDDPYVKNLRCATSGGSRVYPNEAC